MKTKKRSRKPISRKRKFLYTLITLAVIFGSIEGVCRYKEWRDSSEPPFEIRDPYCNHIFAPNRAWELKGIKGATQARTNAFGHRDDDLSPEKEDGTLRIACLGGSTTYGFGASTNGRAYPNALEEMLQRERPGTRIEVLNAGIPGWNLRTSMTNFQLRLERLDFDLVVIMHVNNDLYENANTRYHANSWARNPDDVLRSRPFLTRIMDASAACREAVKRLRHHRVRRYKMSDTIDEGAQAFERNIRWSVQYLRGKGMTPLLCTFPHLLEADKKKVIEIFGKKAFEASFKRCPFEYSAFFKGIEQYNEIVRKVAKEEAVCLVELERAFPKDPSYYIDFIHHNDEGHRIKAEIIGNTILNGVLTVDENP